MKDDSETSGASTVFTVNLVPHGTRASMPEISLLAAVLEDAVHCAQRGSRGVTHRQSSEACEWIASESCDWPFAFVNVCDFLGLDATDMRSRLRIGSEGTAP